MLLVKHHVIRAMESGKVEIIKFTAKCIIVIANSRLKNFSIEGKVVVTAIAWPFY